jgi:hypothetical protein
MGRYDEDESCSHLDEWKEVKQPTVHECETCIKNGSHWVHLRTCQTCGVTLCCDSSPNKHASRHALEAGHPVAISAEPGERWAWCYVHKVIKEY